MDLNRNIFSLALVIVALSVGYFFFVFLPSSKEAELLLSNKTACSKMGDAALERYKQQELSAGGKLSGFESSSNHFNIKLNKCIVEVSDTSYSGGKVSGFAEIEDATENRDLVACPFLVEEEKDSYCYTSDINANDTTISKTQFEQLEKDLMTQ